MALRDPGAPRRNPLFAADEPAGSVPPPRPAADPHASDVHDRPVDDGRDDWADDPIFGGSEDLLSGAPGSAMGPFISALTEAGPEAAEHLVNAAHEFTLAIKVVVDAFERTLADERATFAAERRTRPDGDGDGDPDVEVDLVEEAGASSPRVQNIDLE